MLMLTINPQLDWMQADYTPLKHTFIFTHGPIVGHGGGATHDRYSIIEGTPVIVEDRDKPFVEWVNGADMTVEAVFGGHTHQDHIFHTVTTNNIDAPYDLYLDILPGYTPTIYFSTISSDPQHGIINSPAYIETDTACKEY